MQYVIGTKTISDSNLFLRCLWAEFRKNFGSCAWNYIPFKDGESNTIHFGYADIGIGKPINITIKYKEKGSVSNLIIESEDELASHELENISKCVNFAKAHFASPLSFTFATFIKAINFSNGYSNYVASKYEGKYFSLFPGNEGKMQLRLAIMAFDKTDAETTLNKLSNEILHILTVCTNLIFEFTDKADFAPIASAEEIFNNDAEWIDGFSIVDNKVAISQMQKKMIDSYIGGELSNADTISLAASHYYHALKLQLISQYNMYEELVSVLCISSLEVASILNGHDSKVCSSCGNMIYGIRKRVLSFVEKYGNERLVKYIDNYYRDRSGFLHTGKLLSDRSYNGITIPTLDKYSATGCVRQSPRLPINLIEFTSYLLRKSFSDMIPGL